MIRSGQRAMTVATVPVTGLDVAAVVALEFDARGRLVHLGVKTAPPPRESHEERAARELAEGLAFKLRRIGSLDEALRRARVAIDFLENLAALEELHGPEARTLLASAEGAR